VHREGADLADVLPHDVERAAADQVAVGALGDAEFLHRLVEHDAVLAEQDALVDERADQLLDRHHVRGARTPYAELGHPPNIVARAPEHSGARATRYSGG
jgi:hypothetical protein